MEVTKEQIRQEMRKELARRTYEDYLKYVHTDNYVMGKHIKLICRYIEQMFTGDIRQLIISVPPQHGKSMSITESLPSYIMGKLAGTRVIEASYGDDLARRFGRRNKQKIIEHGKELFDAELTRDSRSDTEFELSNGSKMISRGIMSGITGQSADWLIIDDPIKNRQEADSQTYRDRLWEEWLNSLKTRLSAQGRVILIQTRWHEWDLAGRLLTEEPDAWTEINIPCEAEQEDILGREQGDALFPEIGKDKAWLEAFKQSYQRSEGSRAWNALFQGRPTAIEGNMFKAEWFRYYSELPEQMDEYLQSWDCTFKDTQTSDYVVGQVWARKGSYKYLVYQIRKRMDFVETMQEIIRTSHMYPKAYRKLIEDKANGSAIITTLRGKIEGIIPITPKESKEARASAITPMFEAGEVFIPQNAPWIGEYVEEMKAFPSGKNDDQVDGTSQALNYFRATWTTPQPEKPSTLWMFDEQQQTTCDTYVNW